MNRNTQIEQLINQMRKLCPGCRVGQPYDGHCHTETGDLPTIMCEAQEFRDEIDRLRR